LEKSLKLFYFCPLMKRVTILVLFISVILSFSDLYSQEKADTLAIETDTASKKRDCPQKDILDLIWKKRKQIREDEKRFSALVVPYVGYTPVTRFLLGAGGNFSWHLGEPSVTKLSAGTLSATITLEKQLILQLKTNLYTSQNKWFLQGDWRFYLFNISTYGLGTGNGFVVPAVPSLLVAEDNNSALNGRYPMNYNWLKIHEVVNRKIFNNIYAGIGYHLDYYYEIIDEVLNLDFSDPVITPHYAYCKLNGFNTDDYTTSGLSANLVYDTRDNIINPYRGIYANLKYRYNFKFLGSDQSGSQLWTEFRTYIGLSRAFPRHLLAFWIYGSFVVSGKIPYMDLMSTGFDQMNSSGRGYIQGRWRGEDFVYGEVEYRFPISQCSKILGGVLFLNVTTASNRAIHVPLFGYLKPAGGIGLRIMLIKQNRLNLLIDFAIGQKSDGFYFQTQEVF
jgi:hypothetical protein